MESCDIWLDSLLCEYVARILDREIAEGLLPERLDSCCHLWMLFSAVSELGDKFLHKYEEALPCTFLYLTEKSFQEAFQ